MAYKPKGLGAGGAGGGEYSSDKFTDASDGAIGYIGGIILTFTESVKNEHIKVNIESDNLKGDFPIINIPNDGNNFGVSLGSEQNSMKDSSGKLDYESPIFKDNLAYNFNPLKIDDYQKINGYMSFTDTNLISPYKIAHSKLKHGDKNINFLCNSNLKSYTQWEPKLFCTKWTSFNIYDFQGHDGPYTKLSKQICYVLLQAGGGGGGAADNTWGLLNYAAGGGGGGGGGACVLRIDATKQDLNLYLGSDLAWNATPRGGLHGGPNQASPDPGGASGDTAWCRVTDVNGTTLAEVHATGGKGGTRGYSDDAGHGGMHGNCQNVVANENFVKILKIVDGGDGGTVNNGGETNQNDIDSYLDNFEIIDCILKMSRDTGRGGDVGSQNDRGGGGGASYLGTGGGYYS